MNLAEIINDSSEFWLAFTVIGGILFMAIMVISVLVGLGIVINRKIKREKIIKEIYEQKRENGKNT